ncbi:Oidioi.mRNA.OKI2018_I69.chr1.g1879.t1.cds [Oikopleura dioica]|uniref:Oidioi.mRNA.OKI2018_I69.chr1.g1879.t1.cds n=1 Tax=Oikopleura dioica TaxID=34765 RepID=A0ABN7STJ0_OIKDI|nr:Oidioi.mRNA.OKI2018_I69.chr1.g1879.t1.cds [Oikopleura dioica]
MEKFWIEGEYVAEKNNSSECSDCNRYFMKMYSKKNWNDRCTRCAQTIIDCDPGYVQYKGGAMKLITSTFICPAKKCSARNLSFEDFITGNCCPKGFIKSAEDHFNITDEYQLLEKANQLFKDSTDKQHSSLAEIFNAKKVEKEAQEKLIAARKEVMINERKYESLADQSKIYKRFAEVAMSMISTAVARKENSDDTKACKICFENYDSGTKIESTLHCGHRSCLKCLNDLSLKTCPICRKEFTKDQIIKLY